MATKIIEVRHLKKFFKLQGRGFLHAVDDVSFHVNEGETLGLVGESGCGKTTVGNAIMGLVPPDSGEILYRGSPVTNLRSKQRRYLCRKMQLIFQDPYSSLNPRMTVKKILSEPFIVQKLYSPGPQLDEQIAALSEITGITPDLWEKYPHELDGGKRQITGIARALALNPDFLVCDEPVSALDVSIGAKIINLLMELQKKLGLAYLFISHDLSVVRHISNRIAVMYLGQIVELCDCDDLFENPLHPYTKALLSAIPTIDTDVKMERILLRGDVPSPLNLGPGCRFAGRCNEYNSSCEEASYSLCEVEPRHFVSCDRYHHR